MTGDDLQHGSLLCFAPFPLDGATTWRPQKSFTFVDRLSQIPLSDSELLLSSHYLPIAIDHVDDRLQVVAITASQFQRNALIDAEGQWRRGYMPIALRCFPFRPARDNPDGLEIATDLEGREEQPIAAFAEDGTPTPEIRRIAGLLRRLGAGKRRLQAAAEKLLIADVLTPFQMMRLPGPAPVRSRALTVDRNKFASLSHRRAALIAKDDFLAIDLAAACLFSQRLMPAPISVATDSKSAQEADRPLADVALDFRSTTQLDDSELFSFELFSNASGRYE